MTFTITAPLAEYEKVRNPAWAEYEKVRNPAWAEHEKVCALAIIIALHNLNLWEDKK